MSESAPTSRSESAEGKQERLKQEKIALARELYESREVFTFPGITQESYAKLKAGEEECPGYMTPLDERLERLKNEGMKVALGKFPESGNVYILPAGSDDIENDSISPKHLQLSGVDDEKLRKLVLLVMG